MPTGPWPTTRTSGQLALWAAHSLEIPTARGARIACERAAEAGLVTWGHILVEEVADAIEAGAVASGGELRAELVQVAAVVCAWLEDLDREAGR